MKPKPIYCLLIFTSLWQVGYSQINQFKDGSLPTDSTTSLLVELNADRSDISNALNRSFLQKFAFGGFIDTDLKESVGERLESENLYRGLMNPSLSISVFPESKKFGYLFSYRYTNLINFDFSKDLFNLVFYGNAFFGNEIANLSKSYFRNEEFQSLSFGLISKKSGSFLSIGIYDGIDFWNFKLGTTAFATDFLPVENEMLAQKTYLSTRDSEFTESSQNYKPFGNGAGIGISGAYNFEKSDHSFRVAFTDLGFIYWDDLSFRDTSGHYEFSGFNWRPGESGQLSNVVETLVDSLIPASSSVNEWILLPGYVEINYYAPAKKRLFLSARALHYYGKDYYSEFSADLNVKYGNKNFIWLTAGVGDYSKYLLGLGTEFSFYERGVFRLGTRHILGFIDSEWTSTSIYFTYSHRL